MQKDDSLLTQPLQLQSNNSSNNDKKCNKKSNKQKKNQYVFDLSQEVVYLMMHSLNQGFVDQKQRIDQIDCLNIEQLSEILVNKIKPIPYNKLNQLRMSIRASLVRVYINSNKNEKNHANKQLTAMKESQRFNFLWQKLQKSIKAYTLLSQLLKQLSIPSPTQQGIYRQYVDIWKYFSQQMGNEEKIQQNFKTIMLSIWNEIPYQILETHLENFNLNELFVQIKEDKLIKHLQSLLTDNKIQQCCTYYQLYLRKYTDHSKLSAELLKFQDTVLTPKITKSDHIFANHVISLFQTNENLKKNVLNSQELSPAIGLRVVDLLKQDGRNYKNINNYISKQHYKSIIYDHKTWYMVQDKLSFDKNFIQWYAEDLVAVVNKQCQDDQQNDKLEKIAKEIQDIENVQNLRLSILKRINIATQKQQSEFDYIQNPLYEKDQFDCAEIIIDKIKGKSKQQIKQKEQKYLRYENLGVKQSELVWIDKIDQEFQIMVEDLLSSQLIGFDTQFRCVSTKYEQQGVSLIQLSNDKTHYLIDFLILENSKEFNQFLVKLLCHPTIKKIGHTTSSDIKYLTYTLHIPQDKTIQSFVDVADIFRKLHPGQKYSSLAYLCERYLNRILSKYQQRSNWNRRPLKKSQMHYAALDAYSCLLIYEQMLKEKQENSENSNDNRKICQKQKQVITQASQNKHTFQKKIGDIVKSDNIVYHKKYQQLINSQQPKFLVDNMLKKLSSVMRNCGLDAEYISIKDYDLATELAQKEERIILTRDTKFFQRKDNKVPIYLINQRNDSEKMFQQIVEYFEIDLSQFEILSRCVKCNGDQLIVISAKQARKQLNFKYDESKDQQYWRCAKCKQIYWEGGQFEKSVNKYSKLVKEK